MLCKRIIKIFAFLFVLSCWLSFLYADEYLEYSDMSLFVLWLHRNISVWFDSLENDSKLWYVNFIKKLKDYSSISVISVLEFSSMKEISLRKYMDDTSNLLKESDFIINDLQQKVNILKSDMQDCLDNKSLYDSQFFQALELYDQSYADQSIENSINYQKCASENRIRMNSNLIILDIINYYYNFIKNKYDYISSKQDIILRNFDFMKTDVLDELIETRDIINNLNYLEW